MRGRAHRRRYIGLPTEIFGRLSASVNLIHNNDIAAYLLLLLLLLLLLFLFGFLSLYLLFSSLTIIISLSLIYRLGDFKMSMCTVIKNYVVSFYVKKRSFIHWLQREMAPTVGVTFFTNYIEIGRPQEVFRGRRGIA